MIAKILPFLVPGIIFGIGAIGVGLVLRFLKFPDLTALGSIMVGGTVCIWAANNSNWETGLVAAGLSGAALGATTGCLIRLAKIQPVLAGIITYTGSFTIGYGLAQGGTLGLLEGRRSLFSPVFSPVDVLTSSLIALAFCVLCAVLVRTKIGSLMLALTATPQYVRNRHRSRGRATVALLAFSNCVVGIAGGLMALKLHSAEVRSYGDFLPFSLGAVFGGNAVAAWLARRVHTSRDSDSALAEGPASEHDENRHPLLRAVPRLVRADVDDSYRLGFLCGVYVVGCVLFQEVSGLVGANAFITIHPSLVVNPSWQWAATAALIAAFVWWAGGEEA